MEQPQTEPKPALTEIPEFTLRDYGRELLSMLHFRNWGFRKNMERSREHRRVNPLPLSKLDNLMTYGTPWPDSDNPWNVIKSPEASPSSAWQILRLPEEEAEIYRGLSDKDAIRYLNMSSEERTEYINSLDDE